MWNADIFVFKILLHNNRKVFHSASNEGIAGGKWVFLCVERGILLNYRDLEKALQTLKIPD